MSEKKKLNVQVEPATLVSEEPKLVRTVEAKHNWKPGFGKRFPWIGFIALLFQFIAAGAVTAILLVSDGAPATTVNINVNVRGYHKSWSVVVPPNVLLNIVSVIANLLLTAAVGQGIAIAWWRAALKGGTVSELQDRWAHGTSLLAIFKSLKRFSFITLAALGVKIFVIDSTLLQKATSAQQQWRDDLLPANITGSVYKQLPPDFTGVITDDEQHTNILTAEFHDILDAYGSTGGLISINPSFYSKDFNYTTIFTGCSGYCRGWIAAAGFHRKCTVDAEPVDFAADINSDATGPLHTIFSTNFTTEWRMDPENYTVILLDQTWMSQNMTSGKGCPGLLRRRHCQLRPAVRQYPVLIQNFTEVTDAASATNGMYYSFLNDSIYAPSRYVNQSWTNVTEYPVKNSRTSFGGVELVMNSLFGGNATLQWNATSGEWELNTSGPRPAYILNTVGDASQGDNVSALCSYRMDDPFNATFNALDEIMLRASIYATVYYGNVSTPFQSFAADRYDRLVVNITDRKYLWGALAVIGVTILCVTPVFYGFWQLGRDVTLGPFEVANAFQAPMLVHPNAASGEVVQLVKVIGDKQVRYGETVVPSVGGGLALAEPALVRPLVSKPR